VIGGVEAHICNGCGALQQAIGMKENIIPYVDLKEFERQRTMARRSRLNNGGAL
jgi:hypothetical protein